MWWNWVRNFSAVDSASKREKYSPGTLGMLSICPGTVYFLVAVDRKYCSAAEPIFNNLFRIVFRKAVDGFWKNAFAASFPCFLLRKVTLTETLSGDPLLRADKFLIAKLSRGIAKSKGHNSPIRTNLWIRFCTADKV